LVYSIASWRYALLELPFAGLAVCMPSPSRAMHADLGNFKFLNIGTQAVGKQKAAFLLGRSVHVGNIDRHDKGGSPCSCSV